MVPKARMKEVKTEKALTIVQPGTVTLVTSFDVNPVADGEKLNLRDRM